MYVSLHALPIIVLLMLSSPSTAQLQVGDYEMLKSGSVYSNLNLKGKVQSLETHLIKIEGATVGEEFRDVTDEPRYTFDKLGNVLTCSRLLRYGLRLTTNYSRSHDGSLISERTVNQHGELVEKLAYNYYPDGTMKSRMEYFVRDTLKLSVIESFDSSGVLIQRTRFDFEGPPIKNGEHHFVNGVCITHCPLGEDSIRNLTAEKFDVSGNKILERRFDPSSGVLISWKAYEYDSLNRITTIEKRELLPNHIDDIFRAAFYDSTGLMIGAYEESVPGHKRELKFSFKYDQNRNMILQRKFSARNKLISETAWSFEYDSHGNWIRKIQSGKRGDWVWEREITYYE